MISPVVCLLLHGASPDLQVEAPIETAPDAKVVLTRTEAIRRALAVNPQISAQRAEEIRAVARIEQVDAAKYPMLNAVVGIATAQAADNTDADENGVRSRRQAVGEFNIDQVRPSFLGRLTITQPITTFGKIGHRDRAAKSGLSAAEAQTDMAAAGIAIEVAKLYEAHLYAKDAILFLADVQGVVAKAVEDTQARLDAGSIDVTIQDLLRLKTGVGAAKIGMNQAQAALSQTLEGIRAYLVIPDDTQLEISEAYLDPVSDRASVLEELIEMAVERRPELRALRNGIEAFDSLSKAERAEYFPNLFILGFFSGAYTPGRDFAQSRYVYDPFGHVLLGALVGAQWNIHWDMPSKRADEVRADVHRLQNLMAWAEAGIPAEVNRYHRDVVRARADLVQTDESIPVTREWVVRASADFGAGFGDSRGITDAVQAYVYMKNTQLSAVYRLNTSLAELARATGTLTEGDAVLYPGEGP